MYSYKTLINDSRIIEVNPTTANDPRSRFLIKKKKKTG